MSDDSPPPVSRSVTFEVSDIVKDMAELKRLNQEDQQLVELVQARMKGREERHAALATLLSMIDSGSISIGMAERPAGRVSLAKTSAPAVPADTGTGTRPYGGPKLTQKFMTLSALKGAPKGGLLAIEIVGSMRDQFAKEVERTSLSPLLAKMASAKAGEPLVVHHKDVNRWSITDHGIQELKRLMGEEE